MPPTKSPPPANSIAILPFVNMSSDPDKEYFSDGITEEIINALSYLVVHHGYTFLGAIGAMQPHEAFGLGKPYLDKAIELNPDLPEEVHRFDPKAVLEKICC